MKKKLTVLFLSPSLANQGGVAKYCSTLLKYLNKTFKIKQVTIGNRRFNNSSKRRIVYPIIDSFSIVWSLFLNKYEVIHLNTSLKRYALLRDSFFLMILRIMGYSDSTVLFIHGWDNRLFENMAKHKYLRRFICWLYSNIAAILVLSNKFRLQLNQINIPFERIKVTTTMYVRNPSVSLLPMNKKINILFMSRFVREKGLYIAAETAKLLHDNEGISCSFTFAGDGIEMEEFKSYLAKHDLKGFVDLVGYVSGRKKDEILLRSEIFLFPTQYGEGCPVSILEAMGAGLAIISTPVGGIPEVVEDGINGFLHDSVNPLIFFKTVKRLIEDRKLLTEIQKRNIKKAERYYESSIVGKKMEELYNEVAKINK